MTRLRRLVCRLRGHRPGERAGLTVYRCARCGAFHQPNRFALVAVEGPERVLDLTAMRRKAGGTEP